LDKLEDEIDERKNNKQDSIVIAATNAKEKLKYYYSFTNGLIYTVATGSIK
jgi:hypothetical protein